MGYATLYLECINCGRRFTGHPHKVPSVRVDGKTEPVCRPCVTKANRERVEQGLPPLLKEIPEDAYAPYFPEEEL